MALTTDQSILEDGVPGNSTQMTEQPCTANTQFYRGTVATLRSGYLVEATAPASTDIVFGMIEDIGVSANLIVQGPGFLSPTGANGQISAKIKGGSFWLNCSTGADAITQANVQGLCYLYNENTVAATSGGGTRPVAGIVNRLAPSDLSLPNAVSVHLGASQPGPVS